MGDLVAICGQEIKDAVRSKWLYKLVWDQETGRSERITSYSASSEVSDIYHSKAIETPSKRLP